MTASRRSFFPAFFPMVDTMVSDFSFQFKFFPQKGMTPRVGKITTPHGTIETPAFVFCATKGAIKGLLMEDVIAQHTQIILGNTYHLMISPGAKSVQNLGGLAKMSGWNGPTLTDSGGYQIFSMGYGSVSEEIKGHRNFRKRQEKNLISFKKNVEVDENGALFTSYLDGHKILLTPEISIEVQEQIGADLIVALDECTPYHIDPDYTARSMERSHRWEQRSLQRFLELEEKKVQTAHPRQSPQALYGIVQGGIYEELRTQSCDFINETPFFGQAIGGCLGATKDQMQHIVQFTRNKLRHDRPTHLLGIGRIQDIFHGVSLGIDTFDCVHPTRIARHGGALVMPCYRPEFEPREHINLRNHIYENDLSPIEPDCSCQTCQKYSRGYIHYLLKAKEIAALSLIVRHNVHFMNALMQDIRQGIQSESLDEIAKKWCLI